MFDGFQLDRVDVGEVTLRVRYGGTGQPVVLLFLRTRLGRGLGKLPPRSSSLPTSQLHFHDA